jgi:hypothetical protein
MSDNVNKPAHYNMHPSGIEVMDIVKHETFLRGNVIKYVMRAPYKGKEVEDLKKARRCLDLEIELAEAAFIKETAENISHPVGEADFKPIEWRIPASLPGNTNTLNVVPVRADEMVLSRADYEKKFMRPQDPKTLAGHLPGYI